MLHNILPRIKAPIRRERIVRTNRLVHNKSYFISRQIIIVTSLSYFLVIQSRTANPIDWAKFMINKYGAAASTIFFIDGPAVYKLNQNTTITMVCIMKKAATMVSQYVK